MAKNKVLTLEEQKRQVVFNQMTDATKAVALDFDEKFTKMAEGLILIRYDMGARIGEILKEEGTYGSNAVEQLTAYFNIPGGPSTFYGMRQLAETFDREFIKAQAAIPMTNGRPLDYGHFANLARLKTAKDRDQLLRRIRVECLSVNAIEDEIRAGHETKNKSSNGGRKPALPKTAAACLQKAAALSLKLHNFLDVFSGSTLDELNDMAPDKVDAKLMIQWNSALDQLETSKQDIDATLTIMNPIGERLQSIVDGLDDTDDSEDDNEEHDGSDEPSGETEAAVTTAAKPDKKVAEKKSPEKKASAKKATAKKAVKANDGKKGAKGAKGGKATRRPAAV